MANGLFYLSLSLIWVMLLYHMFLMQGGYSHYLRYTRPIKEWESQGKSLPKVSILIPAHNEEVVIERTLKAMIRLDYPKDQLEVIVINDNSRDRTGEIAESYAAKYDFIKAVHTEPPYAGVGKSSALNYGLKHSSGEIIVVYDADNTPERKAVYYLVLALQNDPRAGVVVGKFRVVNAAKNLLTQFINIETICFQWMAQAGRFHWFGVTTIPGTNFAIRRSLIEQLGGWDAKALAEDTELTIRVYNEGYYIRFFPAAITWEQEPENWKVWWKQRTRWARGNQYVVMKFFWRLFSLKRKSIVFDLIYFFFTYFLFFMGVIVSDVLFVVNLFVDLNLNVGVISIILWVLAYFLYVTEVMIALSIEKNQLHLKSFLIVLLMYFTYSQVWILLVLYALYLEIKRVVCKQELKWYKTERFGQEKS
ncbi:glycosyltransferase family 2 protein [Brevibacillus composti]|uniref:Beta-monoglucosyldiacylglycerol synthase n=1 Tax=Brevibacillus composti TaxID=2796470 RepID=A0A7T5EJJ9_9BACL|nr:glycosyltransferase [Brevibacillus composti]QQE73730.1 glycosyltransferase family 2 protein [Brevibacillus composti]QUO40813.1 glycosyltransferase family 2 protein [Brevibacillus composti]